MYDVEFKFKAWYNLALYLTTVCIIAKPLQHTVEI